MNNCPPVLICGFNRPDCLAKVFDAVRAAKPSKLFLALDYPRKGKSNDALGWEACKKVFEGVDWPCEVYRDYATKNMGCRWRMGSAITWFFEHVESGIILEDDCVPSLSMFRYCDELLARYALDERIGGICGYVEHFSFVKRLSKLREDYYFDHLNTCCGWATWRRAWKLFDPYMKDWPEGNKVALDRICRNAWQRRCFLSKFQPVYDGLKSSWATAWAYACLKHNLLFIHPKVSMIENVGFGINATHTVGYSRWADIRREEIEFPLIHPDVVAVNKRYERMTIDRIYAPSLYRRTIDKVRRLLLF